MTQVTRQFIRHPSDIPLEYCITDAPSRCNMDVLSNISQGGLSFHSDHYIEPDQWLHIYIPIDENYFEADAQVCWCRHTEAPKVEITNEIKNAMENKVDSKIGHEVEGYDVGVSFSSSSEAFTARMVAQVCYIEEYKKSIRKEEGRELSSDQAAAEWIEKYADKFPAGAN